MIKQKVYSTLNASDKRESVSHNSMIEVRQSIHSCYCYITHRPVTGGNARVGLLKLQN